MNSLQNLIKLRDNLCLKKNTKLKKSACNFGAILLGWLRFTVKNN